ncbi:MAG: PQQ-binding-like beta-propeller repeat protein [Myxococcota bacterium]|nr:PQQ-binding-like beta-propeller repeat protein [Myxococcota bacterium]MDW8361406.1 PQQ-binding-like beta-propeller repeat protein [Myxococcales bacterium]
MPCFDDALASAGCPGSACAIVAKPTRDSNAAKAARSALRFGAWLPPLAWLLNGVAGCSCDESGGSGSGRDAQVESGSFDVPAPDRTDPPPSEGGMPLPPVPGEWTQHAHDAQRTSYTPHGVPAPWRARWVYVPTDVPAGEPALPRNVQPITGGGRVYLARGVRGLLALDERTGAVAWENRGLEGSVAATPAFDANTGLLWVVTTAGRLYGLDARTGGVVRSATFEAPMPRIRYVEPAGFHDFIPPLEAAGIAFAPLLVGGTVYVSTRRGVVAFDTADLSERWRYDAGADVETPGAYSERAGLVVVATADLYVHGIEASTGRRRWRSRPYRGDPQPETQYLFSWPVIAEQHGLVLMRLRTSWTDALEQFPPSNEAIAELLARRPELQALHALRLEDGSEPFPVLVGHGGWGNGDYMPMGSPPVVRRDGTSEVVYSVIRGDSRYDFRWDSRFGEIVLDDATVPGLRAGWVRWIYFDPAGSETPWPDPFLLTDEQPYVTMAGDALFGGHWAVGHAVRIVDRGPSLGTYAAPIRTAPLPAVLESTTSCPRSPTHHCDGPTALDDGGRVYGPTAFYVRHGAGAIYDQHWSEYSTWIVSNDALYFRTCSGALIALESGDPATGRVRSAVTVSAEAPTVGPGSAPGNSDRSAAPVHIRWQQARAHVGRHVVVEGRIAYVVDNGRAVYVAFRKPHQGALVAIVPARAWDAFPVHPRRLLRAGQLVRLRGRLRWYQGDPALDVLSPAQVESLEAPAR